MSTAFSIGNFFAVGQLAWTVYKSCKGSGGAFEEVSHEVIALHTAIRELQDEIENPDSILNRTGAGKKNELGLLVRNCQGVLQQLNKLLIKYKSLGTASKKTWDRLRWGTENLSEIREKLIAHTSSLTLFLTTLGTGSLGRIEKKLDELIADVRAGRRERTVLTMADDEEDDSEEQWKMWKDELVDDGFTKVELEGHKHWVKAKLQELIDSGGLQEEFPPAEIKSPVKSSSPPITARPLKSPEPAPIKERQPDLQATVEDAEDVEDKTPEDDPASLDNRTHDINTRADETPAEEAIPMDDEVEQGFSKEIDEASDETDDTFLPSDSISNIGLNNLTLDDVASTSASTKRPQPSSYGRTWKSGSPNQAAAIPEIPPLQQSPGFQEYPKPRTGNAKYAPTAPVNRPPIIPAKLRRREVYGVETSSPDHQEDPVSVSASGAPPSIPATRNLKADEGEFQGRKDQRSSRRRLRPVTDATSHEEGTRHSQKARRERAIHNRARYSGYEDYYDSYDSSSESSPDRTDRTQSREARAKFQPSPRTRTTSERKTAAQASDDPRNRRSNTTSYRSKSPNDNSGPQNTSSGQNYGWDPRRRFDRENLNPQGQPPSHPTYNPPQSRAESYLNESRKPAAFHPQPPANPPGAFNFSDPDTIFAEFLRGNGSPADSSQKHPDIWDYKDRGPTGGPSVPPVSVVERPLLLSLEELFRGCHKKMKVTRKVYDENGKSSKEDRILEMDIKPGLKKGSKIKFKGLGDQEEGGQQDLHFIVGEKPHPLYSRDGNDIHQTITINLLESLCGWERTVTTIDNKSIRIEKTGLTQPGSTEAFPNLGMPLSKDPQTRGLFFVKYEVRYPTILTRPQRDMIRDALSKTS